MRGREGRRERGGTRGRVAGQEGAREVGRREGRRERGGTRGRVAGQEGAREGGREGGREEEREGG